MSAPSVRRCLRRCITSAPTTSMAIAGRTCRPTRARRFVRASSSTTGPGIHCSPRSALPASRGTAAPSATPRHRTDAHTGKGSTPAATMPDHRSLPHHRWTGAWPSCLRRRAAARPHVRRTPRARPASHLVCRGLRGAAAGAMDARAGRRLSARGLRCHPERSREICTFVVRLFVSRAVAIRPERRRRRAVACTLRERARRLAQRARDLGESARVGIAATHGGGRFAGWSARASGGTGTFAPVPLTEETEVTGLGALLPLPNLSRERAVSGSIDLNGPVVTPLGSIELNASVFGSRLTDAVLAREVRNTSPNSNSVDLLQLVTASYAHLRATGVGRRAWCLVPARRPARSAAHRGYRGKLRGGGTGARRPGAVLHGAAVARGQPLPHEQPAVPHRGFAR